LHNYSDKSALQAKSALSGAFLFPFALLAVSLVLHLILREEVGAPVTLFGAPPEGLLPHVMPRLVLVGLSGVAFWAALAELRAHRAMIAAPRLRVVLTSLASFAFAAVLVPIGFVPASVLTVVILAVYLGGRSPIGLGLAGVAVAVALYVMFTRVLFVALPPSFLGI